MGVSIRDIKRSWPLGQPLPPAGILFFYDPDTDAEYKVLPRQLGDAAALQQALALSLPAAQAKLTAGTDPDKATPGQPYAISSDTWNGGADAATVLLMGGKVAGTYARLGQLVDAALLVEVDVAAGTYKAATVDAYTKAEADALLTDKADKASTYSKTEADGRFAKPADLAAIVGAAPAALDTLAEIAQQLQQDEQGAAAVLATQQQHTQQIATLQARGGRHRGTWATGTDYLQNDWVGYQGLTYYAKADFTSGSSFDASKWTQFGAGLTPQQVQALNPLTYPVMGRPAASGVLTGYATLNAAISAGCAGIFLNQDITLAANTPASFYHLYSNRATINIPDGLSLRVLSAGSLNNTRLVASGPNATGRVALVAAATWDTAADVLQVVDCELPSIYFDGSNNAAVLRGSTQVDAVSAKNGAAATLFYYDAAQATVLSASAQDITVTDRRPGAPSGGSEELQLYTADSNTRVVPLALTAALTIQSVSAIAARNAQAISFQVNKYSTGAWVAGAERTTLAEANADIAALTAADYQNGAELLFKVTPIDTTKAARGIAVIMR